MLLVATAGLHVLLLLLFTRSRAMPEPFSQQPALLWVPLAEQEPQAQTEPAPQAERRPEQEPVPRVLVPSAPAPASPPPIDWQAEAEGAARGTTEREYALAQRREFGFPKRPEPPERQPPTPFRTPWHAGKVEKFDDGRILYWLSENCYQTIEEDGDVSITRCVKWLDKAHVRSDLFDHLKPEYLKSPEEKKKPDAAESESMLSQRILEDGGERLQEE